MKNFVQDGDKITLPAPADLSSGEGVLVGDIFGVAQGAAKSGGNVVLVLEGVVTLPKTSGTAWSLGGAIYWDNTNKRTTTTEQGNKKIGVAISAVPAANTLGDVRLNGSW